MRNVDQAIQQLLTKGFLQVDSESGNVYASRSNTPLKPIGTLTKKGYLRACITLDGKQIHVMLHRVVWISVNGIPGRGLQIDHGKRGKVCNAIANLEAVTHDENMRRAAASGFFKHVGRRDGVRDCKGRFGKQTAGRLLDGREWNGVPA